VGILVIDLSLLPNDNNGRDSSLDKTVHPFLHPPHQEKIDVNFFINIYNTDKNNNKKNLSEDRIIDLNEVVKNNSNNNNNSKTNNEIEEIIKVKSSEIQELNTG
jgi:hypothetical protein